MDRDKRWERVKEAYDLIVNGTGKPAECMVTAMEESYAEGVTDEFIKPIVHVENGKPVATIEEGDVVIFLQLPQRPCERTDSRSDSAGYAGSRNEDYS